MNLHNDIPRHIAIIMDGNGRWAKSRGLPRIQGHRAGAESVREVIDAGKELGIEYITLYAFSSENWKRPEKEVSALMKLLEQFLESKRKDLMRQNVRLMAIGQLHRLPLATKKKLDQVISETKDNTSTTLVLAISYGSREEIVDSIKRIATSAIAGEIQLADIDAKLVSDSLYTAGIPDPDLLIRTSGELRLSNFLLWQISYAEIYIFDKYWPDFRQGDLFEAVKEYQKRHRRFGAL